MGVPVLGTPEGHERARVMDAVVVGRYTGRRSVGPELP